MLESRDFREQLLVHELTDAGPIPTICDPDGIYPYPSFVETSRRPVLKSYQFISLENDFLRVVVCPDLGGKVWSLVEKESGHDVLFEPASIQPVRILPRFGFIPGGIEVSFPISHTPVQLETVSWRAERREGRLYAWCGERELHDGMQWTVEYSLGLADRFLTQRTCFRNPTDVAHPWMSWSNAAVPARSDTQFHFPSGPVLYHGAEVKTIDWRTQGPKAVADLDRMTGFFWLAPDACAFGAFTPSLGHGLYHVADPALASGMKLWSCGVGRHESWGRAASLSGESYVELQGGPIRDQSRTEKLQPGEVRSHVEFWTPTTSPLDIHTLKPPASSLIPLTDLPAFDWPPRSGVRIWISLTGAYEAQSAAQLPPPPGIETNAWAPSGMDQLGAALEWALGVCPTEQQSDWLFQLGAWQASRGWTDQALETLARSSDDRARALSGRLYLRAKANPASAAEALRQIASPAFALHPQVVFERDLALAAVGPETLNERERWVMQIAGAEDEWVIERRAALLLDQGKPEAARNLLLQSRFQLVHQRYARTELWNRIQKACVTAATDPPELGEDDLAHFGAYRRFDSSTTE
jgi:hypothetical protein